MRSNFRTSKFASVLILTILPPSLGLGGEPETIRLWSGDAPLARGEEAGDIPTLTIFRPDPAKANAGALVICPGGGYQGLAAHEGKPVAEWANSVGLTAFVLRYRLGPTYRHPAMLFDAARAVRTVRARADEFGVDPRRIAVLGFSAGGHLASTIGTHFDAGNPEAADPIDRVSSRPDALVLIYPVVALATEYAHGGSRRNLLGNQPDPDTLASLSNETQVTKETPPTFLVHTHEDGPVPAENSLLFALALRKAGVPVELHLYEKGPHGFGLGGDDPSLSTWPDLCAKWFEKRGFLGRSNP